MLAIRDLCLPYKLHFKTRILCHQKRCILFLYSVFNTHLRRMIAVSGAQGDFFVFFLFFFFTEGFQPVKLEAGSYGGAMVELPVTDLGEGTEIRATGMVQRDCACVERGSHGKSTADLTPRDMSVPMCRSERPLTWCPT